MKFNGKSDETFTPANSSIAFGKFTRAATEIYLMATTGKAGYSGELKLTKGRQYFELDPQTGKTQAKRISQEIRLIWNLLPCRQK